MRSALAAVLADPALVLDETRRLQESERSPELDEVLSALGNIEARQRRLVRLFTDGELPHELLEEERTALSKERHQLEALRLALEPQKTTKIDAAFVKANLPKALAAIRSWVEQADGNDLELLLSAVDAKISAQTGKVTICSAIPVFESENEADFVTTARTSAYSFESA